MALKLKRSFQLDKNDQLYSDLCQAHAELYVAQTMVEQGKKELVNSISKRSAIINDLLSKYNYVLDSSDRVAFFEQTGEIRILQNEPDIHGKAVPG